MRGLLLGLSVALLVGAVGWVASRVATMEASEADVWGHRQRLGDLAVLDHHQLVVVGVHRGQSVVLEACSDDGFADPAWDEVSFEVWYLPDDERVVAKPMRALRSAVRRDARGVGCVVVTRRAGLGVDGELALGAAWSTLPAGLGAVEVQGHGIVWEPVGAGDRTALGLILLATLGLGLGLCWPQAPDPLADGLRRAPLAWWRALGLGVGALALTMGGLAFARVGAAGALGRAAVLALVETVVAFALVRRVFPELRASAALRWVAPPDRRWRLILAPLLGVFVVIGGGVLMRLVPSTSAAPIESFVAAPSGALAAGAVALFVPLAEETFFRGFVYGVVDSARGANAATLASVGLFVVAHLPQQWGAWGPVAAVALLGVVLTLLRRVSGSTAAPLLAHLAHNAWITLLSF